MIKASLDKRKKEILRQLDEFETVNTNAYNNDGLYNEMRILKEKLEQELKEIESKENR